MFATMYIHGLIALGRLPILAIRIENTTWKIENKSLKTRNKPFIVGINGRTNGTGFTDYRNAHSNCKNETIRKGICKKTSESPFV